MSVRRSPSLTSSSPLLMGRRPSQLGTPTLGMVAEEISTTTSAVSAHFSADPYERAGFSATVARRASLLPTVARRKLVKARTNRRGWAVLLGAGIIVYLVWQTAGGSSNAKVQRAKEALQHQHCRFLPHLDKCRSDPFAGLVYKRSGGLLYYPASLSGSNASTNSAEEIPPPQPHPIHLLIREAEAAWQEKLARQSKTLEDAVAEYHRRYNRPPPLGFDKWWAFATEKGVQLLDEYDSIYEKILPYESLPRDVLLKRSDMLQNDEELWLRDLAFTVEINAEEGGRVEQRGPMVHQNARSDQVVVLLDGISQYVPVSVNLTITGHDVPWIVPSGEAMEKHRAAARAGKYIDEEDHFNFMDDLHYDGWSVICPPGSPIRDAGWLEERLDDWAPPETPSFIQDHPQAMDICQHPENQPIHGFTSWPGPRPCLLFPVFAFTVSSMHADLLIPPLEQYDSQVGPDPDWKDKKMDKVVWRGSTTGFDPSFPHMRKWSQRPRLARLHKQTGLVTVPLALQDKPHLPGPATSYTEHASALAEHYFDFLFQGFPQQCGDEKMCKEFEREFEWAGFMPAEMQNEYKYVMDIDGNGWSGRFHRLMMSNTLVLKSTVFPEWYKDRIQPWVHYVPVNVDYTDLWAIMAFFKGDLDGNGSHDHLAEKIATEGRNWTEQNWRWEDMQAYFLRLILEYARAMNKDPENPTNMDYVSPESPEAQVA